MLGQRSVAKGNQIVLAGYIRPVCGDPKAVRATAAAEFSGFFDILRMDIAEREVATLGRQLHREFSAHSGSGTCNHRNFVLEIFHRRLLFGADETE